MGKRFVLAALAVGLTVAAPVAAAGFDVAKADRSVVRIFSKDPEAKRGLTGSGFVITDNGYVVTNFHVVAAHVTQKWSLSVVDAGGLKDATVTWSSPEYDLAIIQVEGLDRPPAPIALDEPRKGEPVFAVGFPGKADRLQIAATTTLTNGLVSRKFRAPWRKGAAEILIIQHNADINKGNSGGPLFNACGSVVGINTQGSESYVFRNKKGAIQTIIPTSGMFFASSITELVRQIRKLGLSIKGVSGACTPDDRPMDIYLYVAIAAILGLTAILLSLRRPRERVVRVVETYSQMLRRKGSAPSQAMAGVAPPPPARQAPPRQSPSPRPEPEKPGTRGPAGEAVVSAGWVLRGQDGSGNPIAFTISERELRNATEGLGIGRNSEACELPVPDRSVSRRHARLILSPAGVQIEDLESSNGTLVDGARLAPFEPVALQPGASIRLGEVSLTWETA